MDVQAGYEANNYPSFLVALSTLIILYECSRFLGWLMRVTDKTPFPPSPFSPNEDGEIHGNYMKSEATSLWIHFQKWLCPSKDDAPSKDGSRPGGGRGNVVVVHGLGEHSGRYRCLCNTLHKAGYDVFALNHMGHGRSEGFRVYLPNFDYLVDDLLQFLRKHVVVGSHAAGSGSSRAPTSRQQPPLFLIGHSMGGIVATLAAERLLNLAARSNACSNSSNSSSVGGSDGPSSNFTILLTGLILSAPAFSFSPKIDTAWNRSKAKIASYFFPKLILPLSPSKTVCSNESVMSAFQRDPLVLWGAMPVKTAYELLCASERAMQAASALTVPILLQHGDGDKVIPIEGSIEFVKRLPAALLDKRCSIYAGPYHELYNEPKKVRDPIIAELLEWITTRTRESRA